MKNDTFTLSLGQAQQIEFAFRRNGWSAEDVHKLVSKDTLAKVLLFLKDDCEYVVPEGMRLVSKEQATRLAEIQEQSLEAALRRWSDYSIEQVFTLEVTAQVGASSKLRATFLNSMKESREVDKKYGYPKVSTIGELVRLDDYNILRRHNLGRKALAYARQVLATKNLQLGM
ncbi:MAG: hypothetical protein ABIT47_00505 [Candidatus Paceibacterota bacterium]